MLAEFQLTPARGGRRPTLATIPWALVSTHARARRATSESYDPVNRLGFQLTPARGGRLQWKISRRSAKRFQLTPARGGRHTFVRHQVMHWRFNSRPRAAGDGLVRVPPEVIDVSTHARARRATSMVRMSHKQYSSFNSRPRAAGDIRFDDPSLGTRFQLTPARGGRLGRLSTRRAR